MKRKESNIKKPKTTKYSVAPYVCVRVYVYVRELVYLPNDIPISYGLFKVFLCNTNNLCTIINFCSDTDKLICLICMSVRESLYKSLIENN